VPPTNDGGSPILYYTIVTNPATTPMEVPNSGLSINLINLYNISIPWAFTITATNGVGEGWSSTITNVTLLPNVPDPPVNVQVSASIHGIVVSFLPPANDGGVPITGYRTYEVPSGTNATGGSSPITVGGLSFSTEYVFRVFAQNSVGWSAPSSPSESISLEKGLEKSLAIPIAGGVILGLLLIISLCLSILYCRNNEKLCFANNSETSTKNIETHTHSDVNLDSPYKTETPAGEQQGTPTGYTSTGYPTNTNS